MIRFFNKKIVARTLALFMAILFTFVAPNAQANSLNHFSETKLHSKLNTNIKVKSSMSVSDITIKAGTPIDFKTTESLTSKTLVEGQTIKLKVASDVIVDGKIVIGYGSTAKGKISKLKKRKMGGNGAEMEIIVQSVQAVDGSTIIIENAKYFTEGDDKKALAWGLFAVSFFFLWPLILSPLFVKGEHAIINEGTILSGNIAQSTTVKVE